MTLQQFETKWAELVKEQKAAYTGTLGKLHFKGAWLDVRLDHQDYEEKNIMIPYSPRKKK